MEYGMAVMVVVVVISNDDDDDGDRVTRHNSRKQIGPLMVLFSMVVGLLTEIMYCQVSGPTPLQTLSAPPPSPPSPPPRRRCRSMSRVLGGGGGGDIV